MRFIVLSLATLALGITTVAGAASTTPASRPTGLSSYGRIIWNLDALVRDFYGGVRTCMRTRAFVIHRCSSPSIDNGDYRATFKTARHSAFRAVARARNPVAKLNVLPVRIGSRYIACGAHSWLAVTNAPVSWGEPVACVVP